MPSEATRAKELAGLIERVEAATGPDRELDSAVFAACGMQINPKHSEYGRWSEEAADGWGFYHIDRITASIDAAVALVERLLPGWFWRGGHVPSFHWTGARNVDCWAHLSRTDASNCDKGDEATGWCNTVPLAILAALLRALQESQDAQ